MNISTNMRKIYIKMVSCGNSVKQLQYVTEIGEDERVMNL